MTQLVSNSRGDAQPVPVTTRASAVGPQAESRSALLTSRRSLITGLAALVAAPAIVKVADLMPINPRLVGVDWAVGPDTTTIWSVGRDNSYLTINEITREAVRSFQKSNENEFVMEMDRQYRDAVSFYEGERWDKVWFDELSYPEMRTRQAEINAVVAAAPLALAAAAVAVAPKILEKPVTRRFWGK